MVLGGIIQERQPEVEATLAVHGLKVRGRLVQDDWVALVCAN
jgi:ribosomal protein L11 methylase PrmA